MADITLIPLDESALAMLEAWFEDTELRARLGGMVPLRRWYHFVSTEVGRFTWMAYDGDTAVGMVDLEILPDAPGALAVAVKPELRNLGYGKRILRTLLSRPEAATLKAIEVGIEPDNVPSIRCFTSVGFVLKNPEPDAEGILKLVYRPRLGHSD